MQDAAVCKAPCTGGRFHAQMHMVCSTDESSLQPWATLTLARTTKVEHRTPLVPLAAMPSTMPAPWFTMTALLFRLSTGCDSLQRMRRLTCARHTVGANVCQSARAASLRRFHTATSFGLPKHIGTTSKDMKPAGYGAHAMTASTYT